MRRQHFEDGNRVREAGRLDQHAAKRRHAVLAPPHQQVHQRSYELTLHAAAHAPAFQHEHVFTRRRHQQVVDADCAEFVDDNRAVGELRVGEHTVEQSGLAAAQEAREYRDWNFF